MQEKVIIVGEGRIGKAIKKILKNNPNINIFILKKREKNAEEIFKNANYIFLCIPSFCLYDFLIKNKKYIPQESIIAILSKGIVEKTKKTPYETVQKILPQNKLAVIMGPIMAEEIKKGKKAYGIIGSSYKNFLKIKNLFLNSNLSFIYTKDILGISWCGILKNIYTFTLVLTHHLKLGLNYKSYILIKILKEMEKITKIFGGKKETVYSEAGLGDLIATAFSPYSKNKKTAQIFLKNKKLKITSEGINSLKILMTIPQIKFQIKNYPLLLQTYKVFIQKIMSKNLN